MQVTIAFVVFQLRFQFGFIGDLTIVIPPVLDVVAANVPQFRCREPALVEVVTNLTVIRDACDIGAGRLQHRTVPINSYELEYINYYV